MASKELRLLIESENLIEIDKYIKNGGYVNGMYRMYDTTPLFIAIDNCHNREIKKDGISCGEEIVLRLITAGADVHATTELASVTPLIEALKQKLNNKIIYELLSAGSELNVECDRKMSPLIYTIKNNYDKDLIYKFIQSGANINHQDVRRNTPLYYALGHDDKYEIAEMLIAAGANINSQICWKISWQYMDCGRYCKIGNCKNKKLTDFLVNKGINLKKWSTYKTIPAINLVDCNYLISLYIKSGVSIESKDGIYGHTPLINALQYYGPQRFDKVKSLLMFFNANPNNSDIKSQTPLHYVAHYTTAMRYEGLPKVCELLLYHGSNIFAKDYNGKTPLDLAFDVNGTFKFPDIFGWISSLSPIIWHYLVYYDENNLRDYFININSSNVRNKLESFLANLKEELNLMKQTFIKANLTFYNFCLLKRFYKSKPIKMCIDELNYNFDQIKEMFPISHNLLITRIKDNIIKNNRKRLLHSLEGIHIRPLPVETENDSQVVLNYDCKYLIGRYFNHHQLVTLFQASIDY